MVHSSPSNPTSSASNEQSNVQPFVVRLDDQPVANNKSMSQAFAAPTSTQTIDVSSECHAECRPPEHHPSCLFDMSSEEARRLKEQIRRYADGDENACPFKREHASSNTSKLDTVIDYGYQPPANDDDRRDEIITIAATDLLMRTPTPDSTPSYHHSHHSHHS